MGRKAHVLQGNDNEIIDVKSSLKKLVEANSDRDLYSYQQLHRLSKEARDNGESSFTFSGKRGNQYKISWWEV